MSESKKHRIEELKQEEQKKKDKPKNPNSEALVYPTYLNELVKKESRRNLETKISSKVIDWTKIITKQILWFVFITWVVFTVTFFIVDLSSGDPYIISQLPPNVDPDIFYDLFHLNTGIFNRYFMTIGDFFTGNMHSWNTGQKVGVEFWPAFGITMQITFLSIGFAILIGIPLGLFLTRKETKIFSFFTALISIIAMATPAFVIAIILGYVFNALGMQVDYNSGLKITTVLLAAFSVSIPLGFGYAKYLRAEVKQEYQQQYVRLARIKGASESRVMFRHIARAAVLPIIYYLPILLTTALTGSLLVELVFNIPGSGSLFVKSAVPCDQNMLIFITLVYSMLILITTAFRNILIQIIDPRKRVK